MLFAKVCPSYCVSKTAAISYRMPASAGYPVTAAVFRDTIRGTLRIVVIRQRRIRRAGLTACMDEVTNACEDLVAKDLRFRPLGRSGLDKWSIWFEDSKRVHLNEEGTQTRNVVDTMIGLRNL